MPRLGALLTVRRSLPLSEASVILGASIAGIRAAVAELAGRLSPLGMLVVEDRDTVALVPHRAFTGLADRAVTAMATPKLTHAHIGILGIVIHGGSVTRRRIDDMRGVDSAEAVAQLVEWGFLRREGTEGRSPLYQVTAKLLEVTGTASVAELRQQFFEHLPRVLVTRSIDGPVGEAIPISEFTRGARRVRQRSLPRCGLQGVGGLDHRDRRSLY